MEVIAENTKNKTTKEWFKDHNIARIIEPYKAARTKFEGLVLPHRLLMWYAVADIVADHVDTYTVPQYGDYPNDQLSIFSVEDINTQLTRYCNRFGKNARGEEEELRDLLKIMHYAGVAFMKKTGCEDLYKNLNEEILENIENKEQETNPVTEVGE